MDNGCGYYMDLLKVLLPMWIGFDRSNFDEIKLFNNIIHIGFFLHLLEESTLKKLYSCYFLYVGTTRYMLDNI